MYASKRPAIVQVLRPALDSRPWGLQLGFQRAGGRLVFHLPFLRTRDLSVRGLGQRAATGLDLQSIVRLPSLSERGIASGRRPGACNRGLPGLFGPHSGNDARDVGILVNPVAGADAMVAVPDDEWPPPDGVPANDKYGRELLAFCHLFQIVGNVGVIAVKQGKLRCAKQILGLALGNVASVGHGSKIFHQALGRRLIEDKAEVIPGGGKVVALGFVLPVGSAHLASFSASVGRLHEGGSAVATLARPPLPGGYVLDAKMH